VLGAVRRARDPGAPIYAPTIRRDSPCPLPTVAALRVEPEVAFRLAATSAARHALHERRSVGDRRAHGDRLISPLRRPRERQLPELLADNRQWASSSAPSLPTFTRPLEQFPSCARRTCTPKAAS
jgi:hypothetical protein